MLMAALATGCFRGPGFMQSESAAGVMKDAKITSQTDTSMVISLGASSVDQSVKVSSVSGLEGASIMFPAGALSVSTSVTIEEGATIASSTTANDLNMGAGTSITAASAALAVMAGNAINTTKPFTLSIPVTVATLKMMDTAKSYIVVYKVTDASTGKVMMGVLPTSVVTVSGSNVSFQTNRFGVFQIAECNIPVTKKFEGESSTPIMTMAKAKAMPSIEFGSITIDKKPGDKGGIFKAEVRGIAADRYRCLVVGSNDKTRICGHRDARIEGGFVIYDSSRDEGGAKDDGDSCGNDKTEFFVRFECVGEGRMAKSNWSDPIKEEHGISEIFIDAQGQPDLYADCKANMPIRFSSSRGNMDSNVDFSVNNLSGYNNASDVISKSLGSSQFFIRPYALWDGMGFSITMSGRTSDGNSKQKTFGVVAQQEDLTGNEPAISMPPTIGGGPLGPFNVVAPGLGQPQPRCGAARASIAVGDQFACVLTRNGQIRCWGTNLYGQLGRGHTIDPKNNPDETVIFNDGSALKPLIALQVAAGKQHACAVAKWGDVYCWGSGGGKQLGNNSTADSSIALKVPSLTSASLKAVSVSVGEIHSCALLSDRTIKCWGSNALGELGDGTGTDNGVPVGVSGITGSTAVTSAVSLSSQYHFNCAVMADTSAMCWGENGSRQLGSSSNPASFYPSPNQVVNSGAAANNFVSVTAGQTHACGLTSDSRLRCWGSHNMGELGHGASISSFIVPSVELATISSVGAVAAGTASTCFLKTDKTVACTGDKNYGSLGDGSSSSYVTSPVSTLVFTGGSKNTQVVAISAYSRTYCAVLADSRVFCWGRSTGFILGNGSATDQPTPAAVEIDATHNHFYGAAVGAGYRLQWVP